MARGEGEGGQGREPNAEALAGQHPMVVCLGGPRQGACYWRDYGPSSWTRLRALAAADPSPGDTVSPYVETGEYVSHPTYGVRVQVWRWPAGQERRERERGRSRT